MTHLTVPCTVPGADTAGAASSAAAVGEGRRTAAAAADGKEVL